jgi:electron transfer flavoprotein alpha subunit
MRFLVLGEFTDTGPREATIELALAAARLAGDPQACAVLHLGETVDAVWPLPVPLVTVTHPALARFEAGLFARVLAACVRALDPDAVLASATSAGRAVLPAAAALLRCGLTADCTDLAMDPEAGGLLQIRPAFGGSVVATIASSIRPRMATVRPRSFPVPAGWTATGTVRRLTLPVDVFDPRGVVVPDPGPRGETSGETSDDGGLEVADVVVAGGRGLRRAAGFDLLRTLAARLGGRVAASRGAVEAGWIGHEHQVGLSGRVVSPRLYVAVGISGAVQHLAGMRTAGTIVAINRDPRAPIMQAADLALVGDAWELVPRILERLARAGRWP